MTDIHTPVSLNDFTLCRGILKNILKACFLQNAENIKLFHKLINRQRGRASTCVNKLHVGEETFRTENEILISGWHQHFKQLATPKDKPKYTTVNIRNL